MRCRPEAARPELLGRAGQLGDCGFEYWVGPVRIRQQPFDPFVRRDAFAFK